MTKRIITTEVFVLSNPYNRLMPEDLCSGDVANKLSYSTSDMAGIPGYIIVGKGAVTFELQSIEQVTASQVATLREQIRSTQAKAHFEVIRLEQQIRNLQALPYEPA